MNDEMRSVGEIFRLKRKEMNLTLKEVENGTSIRSVYLEAIEEGKIQDYISSAYALGFVRQYGSFLGMDMDKLHRDHSEAFQLPKEKHDFAYGIGTFETRGAPAGSSKRTPSFIWVLGGGALLGLGWYLAKHFGWF